MSQSDICDACGQPVSPGAAGCAACGKEFPQSVIPPADPSLQPDSTVVMPEAEDLTAEEDLDWEDDEYPPPVALWIALAAAVTVVIGSLGPWIVLQSIFTWLSIGGASGDGQITVALGIVAAILLFWRAIGRASKWTVIVSFLSLAIATSVGVYDWNNLTELSATFSDVAEDSMGGVEVGWGLLLVVAGGVVGTLATLAHLLFEEDATG